MLEKIELDLAIVTTYPPTECGIATYSKAIIEVCEDYYIKNKIKVVAIDSAKCKYPKRVIFKIDKLNSQSYVTAADYINQSSIKMVSLQHEYGLYGGKDGKYIVQFLERVKKPVVTTMHSVLDSHTDHRKELTKRIIELSQAMVVMTNASKKILQNYFGVKNKKIYVVPHGGPNIKPEIKVSVKEELGFKDKIVLSTFGLINPGKGIEYAIKAMNILAKKYSGKLVYLVLGATHPDIKKRDKEAYRDSLKKLVKKYHLEKNVRFINKYLTYQELVNYLKATDIYLAPQLGLHQAVSGTLAYAICSHSAIISTGTLYAKEILASKRGIIVPEKNYKAIVEAVSHLLDRPERMETMRFEAYRYARNMIFPRVALEYIKAFEIESQRKTEDTYEKLFDKFYFAPSLRYIDGMTTSYGIVQHAQLDVPDFRHGYSIDDQVRALIAVAKYCLVFGKCKKYDHLARRYMSYIEHAMQKNNFFHNFMDKDGNFIDNEGSSDSYARTMWALGYISTFTRKNKSFAKRAKILFKKNQYLHERLTYIRSKAYLILGLSQIKEKAILTKLADDIVLSYKTNSTKKWRWFEDGLYYANAILPYALLYAHKINPKKIYLDIAKKSFQFLDETCRTHGYPSPIGHDGWYKKNGKRALYDQQAIDAADMVLCATELYTQTKDEKYLDTAKDWFRWFHGNNIHHVSLYDYATEGCYDGLRPEAVNLNEGAESIIVYLLAYLKITKVIKEINHRANK